MSTRSIIILTSKTKTVRVYKHCDGYPTGNLPVIAEAIQKTLGSKKGAVKKLEKKLGMQFDVDNLAQAILKVAELDKSNLEEQFSSSLKPKHLGDQSDLEWIYVVDVDAKTVNVYGGGYTGNLPQVAFRKGVVDPMSYIKALYPEYQKREGDFIQEAINEIIKVGFKLNDSNKKSKGRKVISGGAHARKHRASLAAD